MNKKAPIGSKINCAECGNEIIKTMHNTKYCPGGKCRAVQNAKKDNQGIVGSKANCEKCGKEFVKTTHNKKYCLGCGNKKHNDPYGGIKDNNADKKRILKWLKSSPLTVGELSRRLDRSRETIIKLRDEIAKDGYDVKFDKERGKMVLDRTPREKTEPIDVTPMYRNRMRLGFISDTHLNSTCQQLTLCHTAYKIFDEEKMDIIIHTGDVSEGRGMYPGQDQEVFNDGADRQSKYVVEQYPTSKRKTKTHVIGGSHDNCYKKKAGLNFLKQLVCAKRPDLVYEGDIGASFKFRKLNFEALHPSGGIPYARSYRLQKIIEGAMGDIITRIRSKQMEAEEIPNIVLVGHLHVANWLPYLGVQGYMLPCLQSQTSYLKGKGLRPEVGILMVEVSFDNNYDITKIIHDYRNFNAYVKENDY